LFPRYIFARFPTEQLHKITFTRGVQSVVSFGSKPAAVDEAVISLIKSRLGEEGFVCFNDELTTGDRVVITDGPLAHLEGIFERKLNGTKRVSILLFTVRLQSRLIIERDCVQKVERGETEIRPRTVSSERRACVAR
jgi:transcription antitermination factor NusG